MNSRYILLTCLFVCFSSYTNANSKSVTIAFNHDIPQVRFAAREIEAALGEKECAVVIKIDPSGFSKPQSYKLKASDGKNFTITGSDASGAMYGGLHLAEAIRIEKNLKSIQDASKEPYILKRGIKFNIPLDARSPSYDDTGDAAKKNVVEMWNFNFWREFLDDMARHRYNVLTLWSCHPYPCLVKLAKYPDVALDNVCVWTGPLDYKTHRNWKETSLRDPNNLRVIKKMTIDEKITFWRKVMQYADDRGIEIFLFHWNIYTYGATGKYGITDDQTNEKTIAYLRECVKQTLLTYPHLSGIGVTAGEHMKKRNDKYSKENCLWRTYGQGVMDAKKFQPDRRIRFIFRRHQSSLDQIMQVFEPFTDTFETSIKYARARLYSGTAPPFFDMLYREDCEKHNVKCWMNLRNDDIFVLRWGDPDYTREFLRNLPHDLLAGFYMGPDGYVWGREFTSTEPDNPRQLEIKKHWYRFMLWGRLGYDPNLDNSIFEKMIEERFPEVDGSELYETWSSASKIIPLVNRFHWRDWDLMWSVEACLERKNGFHTVRDFIRMKPMEKSGILSIPDYVKQKSEGRRITETTPLQVAETLQNYAKTSLTKIANMRRDVAGNMSKEVRLTLGDMEAMSCLGNYYASKIQGAVCLHEFEITGMQGNKTAAVQHLIDAKKHWKKYADVASSQYRPQLLARTRMLDWKALLKDVEKDIDIARGAVK